MPSSWWSLHSLGVINHYRAAYGSYFNAAQPVMADGLI